VTPGNAQQSKLHEVRETPMHAVAGGILLRSNPVAAIGAVVLLVFAIRAAVHGSGSGVASGSSSERLSWLSPLRAV